MSQFKNLVFEGGGVKGIAYAGAIKVLDEKEIIPDIKRVAGTSAGAITAALLALGANWQDIKTIVGGTNFEDFQDSGWGYIGDLRRLLSKYGWYKGKNFSNWMKKQVNNFTGNPDLTLGQLAELAELSPEHHKELYVICTNLSKQRPEIMSAKTTPDLPVWEAVRRSMSIPLFFASIKKGKDIYVDGGVTWNYPVNLFDDLNHVDEQNKHLYNKPDYPTNLSDAHIYNKQTLGFRVDTKDEILASKNQIELPAKKIDGFVDFLGSMVGYMTEMANKAHLHKDDWHRTVYIDAAGVKTTDFSLSEDKINALVQNGEIGAHKYFDWFENPTENPINRVNVAQVTPLKHTM